MHRSNNKMKTAIGKVEEAIEAGSEEQAREALQGAASVVQKTASKGSIHKKTASRKVSRLAKRVNQMQAQA